MEKKQWKKMISISILIMFIMMGLVACSNKKEGDRKGASELSESEQKEESDRYKTTFQKIPINLSLISYADIKEKAVYILGIEWVRDKKENFDRKSSCIIRCGMDGSDRKKIELKGLARNESVLAFTVNEKEQIRFVTEEVSGGEEDSSYYLHIADKKGTMIKKKKLKIGEEVISGSISMEAKTIVFSNDNLYILLQGRIYAMNQKGKIKDVYEVNKGYMEVICQGEEHCFYLYGNYGLHKFDLKTGEIEQIFEYGEHGIKQISGLSFYNGRIYLRDQNYLYAINLSSGELEIKFSWINHDMDGEKVIRCFPLKEDKLFSVNSFYDERKQEQVTELVSIQKVETLKEQEKKNLKFYCINLNSYLKSAVLEFNKTNENYRVEIKDYQDYSDPEKQMQLDIIAGNLPDIIDVSGNISKKNLIKKGVLIDLYPLMENDKEVAKENFLSSVLETLEVDQKLYYLPSSFYIQALLAPKNKVGSMEGWSMEDMIKSYEDMPRNMTFMRGASRQWFVEHIVSHQIDHYIEWSTGKVKFTSDEFIKLLEFSKCFPEDGEVPRQEESTQELIQQGKIMIEPLRFPIFSVENIQYYTKLYANQGGFTVLSYPSEDKNNKLCMFFDNTALAITAQCKEQKGAWEFVRQFLTYEYQKELTRQSGIPTRKDTLDKILEYTTATENYIDEDGTKVSRVSGHWDGIPLGALSEKEVEQIRLLIDRVGFCTAYDTARDDISDIISQEAKAFFAGDKTAKEAAEIIQNRVRIYVSENF